MGANDNLASSVWIGNELAVIHKRAWPWAKVEVFVIPE
jgi:hypothetical protein